MKKSLLNPLSIALRCLLLAALCTTSTAALMPGADGDGGGVATDQDQDQDGEGNQECGTTSAEFTTAGTQGTGHSTFFNNDADRSFAASHAETDVKNKLATASGVVCKKCEDGRRCYRSVSLTSGTMTQTFTEIPPLAGQGGHDGGWTCVSTWAGKYKVKCAKC